MSCSWWNLISCGCRQAYADDTQICGSSRSSHVNNTQHPTGSCLRLHRRGVNVDYGQSTAVQPPSRPRYSGVRQLAVNIRSQLDKYVLATRLFCRSLPSATSGSTSTLTSPCLLTSQRPSEPSYKHTASQLHDDCQYTTEWRMFNTLVSLHHTSTGMDQIPAWFLLPRGSGLLAATRYTVNLSVSTSVVPRQWKTAVIRPPPPSSSSSCGLSRGGRCRSYEFAPCRSILRSVIGGC